MLFTVFDCNSNEYIKKFVGMDPLLIKSNNAVNAAKKFIRENAISAGLYDIEKGKVFRNTAFITSSFGTSLVIHEYKEKRL